MSDRTSGSPKAWETFSHDADVGVRGYGATRAEAFRNTARAPTEVTAPLETVAADERIAIACAAPDDEVLLVDWLTAIIFEMATRRMLFRDYRVEIVDRALGGEAIGERPAASS